MMMRMQSILISGLLGIALASSACSGTGERIEDPWPTMSALPASAASDLNANASDQQSDGPDGPRLHTPSDGFVYVSGLDEDAHIGRAFIARFGGSWPISDAQPPAIAAGRLVEVFEDGVGLVHITYQRPDSELDGLRVTWESTAPPKDESAAQDSNYEALGKAVGWVTAIGDQGSRRITLSLGKEDGVRPGDFYALLTEPSKMDASKSGDTPAPRLLQLSRRLTGVCMVKKISSNQAQCHRWSASSLLGKMDTPKTGQQALFLEHTFGSAPREAVIQIARVKNGDDAVQAQLSEAMGAFLESLTEPTASVQTVSATLDASASNFYRLVEGVERVEKPQLVIGSTVKSVDGEDHLIVNYGGVGAPAGPGMLAAPPVGGVDLGPVDELNAERLRTFNATVWAGMLVYRGQTSEALILLNQMIKFPSLTGPLRWHARDQYAMRWSALGHNREALWLVLQDEALAAQNKDRIARLNALGTRVRLYDFLDLPDSALQSAKQYLDERADEKPNGTWRSGLSMYAEMLMSAGKVDEAITAVNQLEEACPKTCGGDLSSFVAGVFWRVPPERMDIRGKLLKRLEKYVDEDKADQVAALRIYQGLMSLRGEEYTQGLIAFLEAERLYKKEYNLSGQARSLYFASVADLGRGEPQSAYERAVASQKLQMQLNDFAATAELFKHMSSLYTNPKSLENPGPFLGGAKQVLGGATEAGLAMGDLGLAGESLLSFGSFQLKIGMPAQAGETLSQAAAIGVMSANFDIAALAHMYSAAVARQNGDMAEFKKHMARAKLMAALSDNPAIIKAVEDTLNPSAAPDIPTQLL